jgi:cell division protein FtsL
MTRGQLMLLLILSVATGWTGLKVVQSQHLSRQLFAERERLRVEADELTVTWGQLQVELATFADYGRVEKMAREKLGMRAPRMDEMQVIR